MAAQIPIKTILKQNEAAFEKVRADKEREALDGHMTGLGLPTRTCASRDGSI